MKISFDLINPTTASDFWNIMPIYKDRILRQLQLNHLSTDISISKREIIQSWVDESQQYSNRLSGNSLFVFLEFIENLKQIDNIFPLSKLSDDDIQIGAAVDDTLFETTVREIYNSAAYDGFVNLVSFYESVYDLYDCGVTNAPKTNLRKI